MKKIKKPEIIGGASGLAIHFLIEHQADFQTLFPIGEHSINGIAFVLAGAYLGLKLRGKR